MKKFENIILASDIDGTFLWRSQPTSKRNLDNIRYFTENGGHFTFSSGRNHKDIYYIIPELDDIVSMPCVLCNGCFCFDTKTKEIINPTYLDSAHILSLINRVNDLGRGRLGWRVSRPEGFLLSEGDEIVINDLKRLDIFRYADVMPLSEFDGKNYFKMVVTSSPEVLKEVFSYIEAEFPMYTYTSSNPRLAEIMPKGITKATQLAFIRGKLEKQYGKMKLFCVGDYDNDEDMLKYADVAMCPENSSDNIKSIASVHLCHCKDGAIGDAIERIDKMI